MNNDYLQTWITRTQSDVAAAKQNIHTYPDTAIAMLDEIANNLTELSQRLSKAQKPTQRKGER